MTRLAEVIRCLRTQLVLVLVVAALALLSKLGAIPPMTELQMQLSRVFETYGLPVVAACALLENVVGFNMYFPGSLVILTGMASTHGEPGRALVMWLVIVAASTTSQVLNYWIGFAFGKSSTAAQAVHPTQTEFLLGFWHPHTASVATVRAGTQRLSFGVFLRRVAVASVVWNSFWGVTMYASGSAAESTSGRTFIVSVFLCYFVYWCWSDLRRPKRENTRS